ncbi:MAG TPA: 4'-phosphopantetheinyl transferase superfamily protein [Kofleriaceae bacterium]
MDRVTATGLGLVLPGDVIVIEARGDVAPDPLFPEETAAVANAVERRRVEFARGRSCARRALVELGVEPVAILMGDDRAPIWPPGVVGTISHCAKYACAAVGHASTYAGIGIDAEILQPLEAGVAKLVVSVDEARALAALPGDVPWPCVAFSAKEAFYKAQYPWTHTFLDFDDVAVAIDPAGSFTITVLKAGLAIPRTLPGRFVFDGERVLCAVVLTSEAAART